MAGEISFTLQGNLKNPRTGGTAANTVTDDIGSLLFSLPQSTADVYHKVLAITTGGVTLATGLASPGYALLIFLDDADFIQAGEYSSATLHVVGYLSPDTPFALVPLDAGATIRFKADTATHNLDVRVWSR